MSAARRAKVMVVLPDGTPVHYERTVSDDYDVTPEPEDAITLRVYATALSDLAREDRRYLSNLNIWLRWGVEQKLRWINNIERQAQAGAATIGVDVVTRAAIIRLGE